MRSSFESPLGLIVRILRRFGRRHGNVGPVCGYHRRGRPKVRFGVVGILIGYGTCCKNELYALEKWRGRKGSIRWEALGAENGNVWICKESEFIFSALMVTTISPFRPRESQLRKQQLNTNGVLSLDPLAHCLLCGLVSVVVVVGRTFR